MDKEALMRAFRAAVEVYDSEVAMNSRPSRGLAAFASRFGNENRKREMARLDAAIADVENRHRLFSAEFDRHRADLWNQVLRLKDMVNSLLDQNAVMARRISAMEANRYPSPMTARGPFDTPAEPDPRPSVFGCPVEVAPQPDQPLPAITDTRGRPVVGQ